MFKYAMLMVAASAITCFASAQPSMSFELVAPERFAGIDGGDEYTWIETDWGVVATADPSTLPSILEEQAAAEFALSQQFNVAGLTGAVIDTALADQYDQIKAAFDLDWVMPWSFDLLEVEQDAAPVEPTQAQKDSIREQITDQLSVGGRTPGPAAIEAIYQQALAQFADQNSDDSPPTSSENTVKPLRHEIAHKLFIAAVWPVIEGESAYGGGAPDWLDEVAAILAEDDVLTASRRAQAQEAALSGELIPLARFLSMQHPAYEGAIEMVRRFKQANSDMSTSGVYSFSKEDFEAAGIDLDAEAGTFYAQARGFIDYLDHRAPDTKTLAIFTTALMDGESFEETLATHSNSLGLPATLPELEADFFTWLSQS